MDQAGSFTLNPRKLILPFVVGLGGLIVLVVLLVSAGGAKDTTQPVQQPPASTTQVYNPCLAHPFDCR